MAPAVSTEAPTHLVDVFRGGFAESGHRGHAAIVDAGGTVIASWGSETVDVMPRSAIKSLQALALVESGAAAAFGLSDEEIALACASHGGEDRHARSVIAWLDRMGLSVADLECGAHPPMQRNAADMLVRNGQPPTAAHNNCSGKHAGFLTTALHAGIDHHGYIDFDHPVQALVRRHIHEMTDIDPAATPWGRDGCSIPSHAYPLRNIALGMARLAAHAVDRDDDHGRATARILRAWTRHPFLIAGTGRFDTALMEAAAGRAVTKAGAEGVSCGIIPDRKLGIVVKVEDGAERAASVVMATILAALGAVDRNSTAIARLIEPEITNARGTTVGRLAPAEAFADDLKRAFS